MDNFNAVANKAGWTSVDLLVAGTRLGRFAKLVVEAEREACASICESRAEINRLQQCLRNVYEVWAGSEGIPAPTVASEAYLLSLVEQMRDAAKEGLNGG